MKISIQIVMDEAHGEAESPVEIFTLHRESLEGETIGLSLQESRQLLFNLQAQIAQHQVETWMLTEQVCPHCQAPRRRKDMHQIRLRTLFGEVSLPSPRFYTCPCEQSSSQSFSPLAHKLTERTTPELLYLQTKWAALMPYGVTIDLLEEVLPIHLSPTSLRRQISQVAERCDQELGPEQPMFIEGCPADWATLPDPDGPLTVGLDGGYIHLRDENSRKAGALEVIVGKSIPTEGQPKCFGFVPGYNDKPRRRVFEALKSQGLQMNQTVLFLSDGGDTVRELQFYLSPYAEHILDWFHITMRLTVMNQTAQGLPETLGDDTPRASLQRDFERLKWCLWHGNVWRALQTLECLEGELDRLADEWNLPPLTKLQRLLHEFDTYIRANRDFIPNYGDRYRYGEMISTAFVESTVNGLISKRFVKKQQMRWTRQGAHQLLQVRMHVLNEDWRTVFERWFPHMPSAEHQDWPQAWAA